VKGSRENFSSITCFISECTNRFIRNKT